MAGPAPQAHLPEPCALQARSLEQSADATKNHEAASTPARFSRDLIASRIARGRTRTNFDGINCATVTMAVEAAASAATLAETLPVSGQAAVSWAGEMWSLQVLHLTAITGAMPKRTYG